MLGPLVVTLVFFFFQAEDGIRDHCVTGVQTCALPILQGVVTPSQPAGLPGPPTKWSPSSAVNTNRSEERRVGKECRTRGAPGHKKKKAGKTDSKSRNDRDRP